MQESHAPVATPRPPPVFNTFIHFDARSQGVREAPPSAQARSLPASPMLDHQQRGGCGEAESGAQVHWAGSCSSPPVKNTFIHYTIPPSPGVSDGSASAQSVPRNWCPAPIISKGTAHQTEVPQGSDAARQEPVVISLQQAMPSPPGNSSGNDRQRISLCLLLSPEAPSSTAVAPQARLPSGCDHLWGGQQNVARQLFTSEGQGTAAALTWEQQQAALQAWQMYSRLGA
mmetsp:Transcript_13225/g.30096  ORF Transcript_13225/g.30096 Transcript_13225/m.30096 type:complete len:229 (-) Transcript_13225:138-824(-)